jgi:hypothetical protein
MLKAIPKLMKSSHLSDLSSKRLEEHADDGHHGLTRCRRFHRATYFLMYIYLYNKI